MYVLSNDRWSNDYLDYALEANELLIMVGGMIPMAMVHEQYIEPRRSVSRVLAYIRKIGVRQVLLKIQSRVRERARNEKVCSIGFGKVLRQCGSSLQEGQWVIFLAPNHPALLERIVLGEDLVSRTDHSKLPDLHGEQTVALYHFPPDIHHDMLICMQDTWIGWNKYSGLHLDADLVAAWLKDAVANFAHARLRQEYSVELPSTYVTDMPVDTSQVSKGRFLTAVIGYGQYAKTTLIPHLPETFDIVRVHEIDPMQIPKRRKYRFSTIGSPSLDSRLDVCFIAGYHHTHMAWADAILGSGGHAVVEKPLVTTSSQLERLREIWPKLYTRYHAGFHKRYQEFNTMAIEDMQVAPGEPISYYATVYEIPLPTLHWYNWPNSRSRITSNACHWIDHFMYLNDFSMVVNYSLKILSNRELVITATLQNNASLALILSDIGTPRLGVREYIELTHETSRCTIIDSRWYKAEGVDRQLRTHTTKAHAGHVRMYKTICSNIERGIPSETPESIRSSELVVCLENLYQATLAENVPNPS